MSNASRAIKDKEAADCEANNIKFIGLQVAYDGMAIVVNPENDWAKDIKVEELKKIWEPAAQGKILRWNQIRAEWPDKELHLFGAGTASGTYDYFTEAIMGKSGDSRGDYTASEDDNVLVQGIRNDPLALGFFGLAYYEENSSILKLVPVDNGNGPVIPNMETVISNTYAPLSRPIYIYVNNVSTHRPEVVKFVNFYLETTKEITKEVGYIPMPDDKITEQKAIFNKFVEENTTK
ncbi:MAG: PstS family phosphate ABC transporter substrate-binding protein [Flavobacteriaceae bacterium]|nr:PstS family phosphate ABC transporter substrate-binding protein [Flavobacteriaceae bacterium]